MFSEEPVDNIETTIVGNQKQSRFKIAANFTIGICLLLALLMVSRHNYLFFHSLAEFFSIAVAFALFIVVWNTRQFVANTAFVYIGIAYLFVGGLDLIHTISYKGMGVISQTWGANPPTQLWISARYLESISLFVFVVFFKNTFRIYKIFFIYSFITVLILLSIFYWKNFPDCFIEGVGLTGFKKVSEYVICGILLSTLIVILTHKSDFDYKLLKILVASIVLTILAELAFTSYVSVYGLSNLIGHYFKILSFFLIYAALVRSCLKNPYKILFRDLNFERQHLKKSKALLEATGRMASVGGWELDVNTQEVTWSEETYRIHQVQMDYKPPLQEAINFYHPNDRERLTQAIRKALDYGEPYDIEARIITAKGNQLWIRTICKPEIVDGKTVKLIGVLQDITERKRTEELVKKQHDLLKTTEAMANIGSWEWDVHSDDTFCSEELFRIFGLDPTGPSPPFAEQSKLYGDGDIERLKDAVELCVTQGTPYEIEVRTIRTDKEVRYCVSRGQPEYNENGEVIRLVGSFQDITERKQAEAEKEKLQEQLRQAQKMEAIGTLAGGIAHDFNNILGAIFGYAEMVQEDCPPGSTMRNDIDRVVEASHRAKELVKQILSFSRQAETDELALQPALILKEAIKMLRASLPTTIDFQQNIDPEAGLILADPTQIHQIITNLCTNAFHAMEETGGTLNISLKNKELSLADVVSESEVQPGLFVEISVGDTGPGIAPEMMGKIFDPFFTTKEVGKGTGMGLAIIHGIAKKSGGFVSCKSLLGEGTTFHVYLPVHAVTSPPEIETTPLDLTQTGIESILFVDDEEMLTEMGKTMLERLGYKVTVETNSIEALKIIQDQPDRFDLVITDQTMPGMTGSDLARRILQIRPGLPIILCTGFSNLISEEKARIYGIKGFAMKPLAKKDLAALVRKVLNGEK